MCRYYEDEKHMARKMDVLVDMQHSLNLEHLRARGPQPDERMQPATTPAAPAAPAVPTANPEVVATLAAIMPGHSENALQRAALAVGNSDSNAALNWLFAHSEDADINDPIGPPAAAAPAVDTAADPQALAELTSMGFTERQAAAALKAGGGGADRAAAWLLDQGEGLDAEVEKIEAAARAAAAPKEPAVRLHRAYRSIYLITRQCHVRTNVPRSWWAKTTSHWSPVSPLVTHGLAQFDELKNMFLACHSSTFDE